MQQRRYNERSEEFSCPLNCMATDYSKKYPTHHDQSNNAFHE